MSLRFWISIRFKYALNISVVDLSERERETERVKKNFHWTKAGAREPACKTVHTHAHSTPLLRIQQCVCTDTHSSSLLTHSPVLRRKVNWRLWSVSWRWEASSDLCVRLSVCTCDCVCPCVCVPPSLFALTSSLTIPSRSFFSFLVSLPLPCPLPKPKSECAAMQIPTISLIQPSGYTTALTLTFFPLLYANTSPCKVKIICCCWS